MLRPSFALAMTALMACGCGRVNYDPVAINAETIDADLPTVDADPAAPDASLPCTATAVTGSYVGDGANGRVIQAGVQPVLLIVQADSGQEAVIRIDSMPASMSKSLVGTQPLQTGMLARASNGFALGSDARVNALGVTYHWVAMPISPTLAMGQYNGNGSGQIFTSLGFRPEWIVFAHAGNGAAVVRMPQPANLTFRLDDGTGVPDGVSSLDADGFTIGTRPFVNENGSTFHYVAWRSTVGGVATGNYVGDDSANHIVGGLGLKPSYVMTHTPDATVLHRFASLPTDSALPVTSVGPAGDTIKSFAPNSFTVGSHPSVNEIGNNYTYSAFATCP